MPNSVRSPPLQNDMTLSLKDEVTATLAKLLDGVPLLTLTELGCPRTGAYISMIKSRGW